MDRSWRGKRRVFYTIKEKPGIWKKIEKKVNLRDKVVKNRLRMEHTKVTHRYRFHTSNAAHAQICSKRNNAILTVKHILVTCPDLQKRRD